MSIPNGNYQSWELNDLERTIPCQGKLSKNTPLLRVTTSRHGWSYGMMGLLSLSSFLVYPLPPFPVGLKYLDASAYLHFSKFSWQYITRVLRVTVRPRNQLKIPAHQNSIRHHKLDPLLLQQISSFLVAERSSCTWMTPHWVVFVIRHFLCWLCEGFLTLDFQILNRRCVLSLLT